MPASSLSSGSGSGEASGCCAGGCCSGAWSGLLGFLRLRRRKQRKQLSQEEFENLITYLGAVPIFRKQLPRAELPRVAEAFKESVWKPGQVIVQRGKLGEAFFIIKSGEAAVFALDADGDEVERAALYPLDYFGGHTLIEKRPNVGTIVAKGPEPLVTLSIDRAAFEELGLHKTMKFPRRPAIYEGTRTDKVAKAANGADHLSGDVVDGAPLTEEDVTFICKAVMANPNMKKAFGGEVCGEKVRRFAQGAQRRRIKEGTDLATSGNLLQDLYVVVAGELVVFSGTGCDQHGSLEQNLTVLTKAQQRLRMKEQFIQNLTLSSQPSSSPRAGRRLKERNFLSMRVDRRESETTIKSRFRGHARSTSITVAAAQQVAREMSPFEVGDRVARVVVGAAELVKEVGTVVDVIVTGPAGEVLVDFIHPARQDKVKVQQLRPAADTGPMATLKRGTCYGELSLLYNTRLITTCRTSTDVEVFVLSRRGFKEAFSRESSLLEEHYRLLDDVHILNPLVRSERWQLARSATGVLEFQANEVVVKQGEPLNDRKFLYVVRSGSCKVKQDVVDEATGQRTEREVSILRRAGHFGERDIFLNLEVAEATVQAAPEGLTVLAIHADILKQFIQTIVGNTEEIEKDYVDYVKVLPRGPSGPTVHTPFSELNLVSLLGEGGFGSVFLARTGDMDYALKRLSKGYVVQAQAEKQVALERDILTMVDSPFIIKLYQTYKDKEYVYMLLELADGGHLYQLLNACKVVSGAMLPSAVMFYIASLTFALGHLHERKIAYRDMKAENVLLDRRGYVKLCDMGFAKFVVEKTHTLLGTPEYMAPEMIDPPHGHDQSVDWWALGVLTFELFTGQDPWYDSGVEGDDPMRQLLEIRDSQEEGIPERLIPPHHKNAKEFISQLLQIKPAKRLGTRGGATQVQQHAWFTSKSFDFDALYRQTMPPPQLPEQRKSESVPAQLDPTASTDASLFAPAPENGSDWDSGF